MNSIEIVNNGQQSTLWNLKTWGKSNIRIIKKQDKHSTLNCWRFYEDFRSVKSPHRHTHQSKML